MTLRIFESAMPLSAAITGPALGIGITMILLLGIRLIANGAQIGFVFARRGIVPEAASGYFPPGWPEIQKALG